MKFIYSQEPGEDSELINSVILWGQVLHGHQRLPILGATTYR